MPRKKHTVRNVLLVLVLLFVLMMGGCVALLGGAAHEIDKAIQDAEVAGAPRDVEEGAAVSIGKYEIKSGWKVAEDGLDGYTLTNVVVENVSDGSDTVFFTVKVPLRDAIVHHARLRPPSQSMRGANGASCTIATRLARATRGGVLPVRERLG